MKILIAMPIKRSLDPFIVLGLEYIKKSRIKYDIEPVFLPPKSINANEEIQKQLEGNILLEKTKDYHRVVLTEKGNHLSSISFSSYIEKHLSHTKKLAFLIGGSNGLANNVLLSAHFSLSLSDMTMPHRMAFLFLSEQIFRAGEIIYNTPYHK